jgi:hypothetical protein
MIDTTTSTSNPPKEKPSRKEMQRKMKADKIRLKMERKEWFRKKAEKKLVEKEERKAFHKKENAQKKLRAKLEKKKISPKL